MLNDDDNKRQSDFIKILKVFVIAIIVLWISLIVIYLSLLCFTLTAYAADGGDITWGQVFEFIDNNFPDTNMQAAVKREIQSYYSWNNNETEEIQNNTGAGPNTFTTPEEVLSWVGQFEVNTKNDKVNSVEGLQYIGKDYLLDTGDTEVNLILDGGICLQELFGELWTNKTELYCKVSSQSGVYLTGCLSDDGYIGNTNDVTIPPFAPYSPLNMPGINATKKTTLVYLRDGEEKSVSVYGNVFRHTSKQDLTSVGKTVKTKIPASIALKDPIDKKWELISTGADEADIRWNLQFISWDGYQTGTIDGYAPNFLSYNFTYNLRMEYYSFVDVEIDSEIYGGFTYRKVSENDQNIKLNGAKFVVSNADGEYLVSEGSTDTEAVFDKDITKAKVYLTSGNGEFQVKKIPVGKVEDSINGKITAQYYVTEIKPPSGYLLDSKPQLVEVSASTEGIQMDYAGGEKNAKVNSNVLELIPQWEKGKNETLLITNGIEPENERHVSDKPHTLYIKNGGNKIEKIKYETEANRLEVLQDADITVKDLNGTIVGTAKSLQDMKILLNDLISNKKMKKVTDSYKAEGTKTLIYYDKDSIVANSSESAENENYQMKNKPLPIKVKLQAKKIFDGDNLQVGDFQFELDTQKVTSQADGGITFNEMSFDKPGTYEYIMNETDQWYRGNSAKDIVFDKTDHKVKIVVEETGKDGLTARVIVDGVEKVKLTSAACWETEYPHLDKDDGLINEKISSRETEKSREPENTDIIFHNIRTQLFVKKTVHGNMGDKTKAFTFQLELLSPDGSVLPAALDYEILPESIENGGVIKKGTITLDSGKYTFQLAHNEQILFKGIPANSHYSIEEIDGNINGYTVTSNNAQGIVNGKEEAVFTNEKNISIPTLASMNTKILIGIAIIALAGILFMKGYYGKQKKAERRNDMRE